jgi:hypothetical protein
MVRLKLSETTEEKIESTTEAQRRREKSLRI